MTSSLTGHVSKSTLQLVFGLLRHSFGLSVVVQTGVCITEGTVTTHWAGSI